MNYMMKLCEKTVGERMLVACLWKVLPCGHTTDYECKECGVKGLEYEEWMMATFTDKGCELLAREFPIIEDDSLSWEQRNEIYALNSKRVLTEREQKQSDRFKEQYRPYQGSTLVVGGKEYTIYDANADFFPCGNAPKIELTEDEARAWRKEFQGTDSKWVPFYDELFLK